MSNRSELPIVAGPQGGFHLWLALRCSGLGDHAVLSMRISDEAGESIGIADPMSRGLQLCHVGDGWHEAAKLFVYLDAFMLADAEPLIGQRAKLQVTLASERGIVGRDANIVLGPIEKWVNK